MELKSFLAGLAGPDPHDLFEVIDEDLAVADLAGAGSGYALTPHIGRQKYKGSVGGVSNSSFASYTDYSLGLTKDIGNGISLSGTLVGTNTRNAFYQSGANGKDLGKTGLVIGAKYTF